jgi:predicted RNase H-like HicB family nuclease
MEYLVVVEKGKTSYGAYVPDLPGCVAAGETRREVLKLIREAVELHIDALRAQGEPVPRAHVEEPSHQDSRCLTTGSTARATLAASVRSRRDR